MTTRPAGWRSRLAYARTPWCGAGPRVAGWWATGARPAVAVWPATLLARFLNAVRTDRLFALWWLIALRGLRRGEAAGLRWTDLDLDRAEMAIMRARTSVGYQVHEGPPKSAAGTRTVALDKWTVAILRAHDRPRPGPELADGAAVG